ncbi:choice-of-anchor L domain-containing protein, partial [Nitrospinae bacterium AH_259_B05_G02_I21]|nr:choice-of-anchor L domain-containing protein [Nitrospinae bacterium AH_259_B05_G02_I21]
MAVLVGDGVTYANVQYTGSPSALGTFTGGEGIVGFPGGVIIGTGNILHVVGPNEDSGMGTE